MRKGITAVMLANLATVTMCSAGDEPGEASLRAGSHVRVQLVGRAAPLVGTLVRHDTRGLHVAAPGEVESNTVPWEEVAVVEVGRTHPWRGIGVGILTGAGTAAGLVGGFGGASEDVGWAAAVGGLGALPGAAAGAVVGARRSPIEGALAGAAATALLFVGLEVAANDPGNDEIPTSFALVAGGALGALSGGVAAAVARETWQPVRRPTFRVSVLPVPGRGVAGRLTVSF